MSFLPTLETAFRAAADELGTRDPQTQTAAELRARLMLQQVRRGTRWMDEAIRGVEACGLPGGSDDTPEDRLFACCDGWVQRASGPFRKAADAWLARVVDTPEAVPALFRYWRISGDETVLKRALAATPANPQSGDFTGAAACWAAYQATAREPYADAARTALSPDPRDVPVGRWSLLAHVHHLAPDDFAPAADSLDDAPIEDIILACAPLALPPVVVDVWWWYDSDLFSGPLAEAATFPYPNVTLVFRRLPHSAQAIITPSLAGVPTEPLEDIGVIAALIDDVVSHVDRTALRDAPRRRRKPSRLLG
jgi:hypothetical protein